MKQSNRSKNDLTLAQGKSLAFKLRWRRAPKEQFALYANSKTTTREKLHLIFEDRALRLVRRDLRLSLPVGPFSPPIDGVVARPNRLGNHNRPICHTSTLNL